jgi:hypothetical protein
MRGYGGVSLNVLKKLDTSKYSNLKSGVSRNINIYDIKEGKGKGQPRTDNEDRWSRGKAVIFL